MLDLQFLDAYSGETTLASPSTSLAGGWEMASGTATPPARQGSYDQACESLLGAKLVFAGGHVFLTDWSQ